MRKADTWHATNIRLKPLFSWRVFFLTFSTEKRPSKRYSMGRVYINAVTAVLSIILALLLLQDHLQSLLYYLLFTIIIAAIVFTLRIRLPPFKMSEPTQENLFETKKWTQRWKAPILMFIMLIAIFLTPLILAWALDPYIWFILMVGFITGFSVSEILFYLYIRSYSSKEIKNNI